MDTIQNKFGTQIVCSVIKFETTHPILEKSDHAKVFTPSLKLNLNNEMK